MPIDEVTRVRVKVPPAPAEPDNGTSPAHRKNKPGGGALPHLPPATYRLAADTHLTMMTPLGTAAITTMAPATAIVPAVATAIIPAVATAIVAAIAHIVAVATAAIIARVVAAMIHALVATRWIRAVVHLGRSRAGHADSSSHKSSSDDVSDFHGFPLGPE